MYDHYGQGVISPLLNVKQLRDLGVTLHLFVFFFVFLLVFLPVFSFFPPTISTHHETFKTLACILGSLLDSDREAIPDVPAIYFVMPTNDNIKRIIKVVINSFFNSFFFNIFFVICQNIQQNFNKFFRKAKLLLNLTDLMLLQ